MSFELDSKSIGEVTEAALDKKFAKAAGVIAGALVGGGVALAGLGPAAVVPAVVTKKLVEALAGRLSETNTEKMLATYRSIGERQEFIQTITREVLFDLQKPSTTDRDAIGELSSNVDAWFTQLFRYHQSQNHGPVLFVSAADVKVIPPDLNREVVLPDHLKDYLQRRLGTVNQRTWGCDKDDRKRTSPRDYDTWRESIRQHEVEYEDHQDVQVLRELVAASSQASPRKLWVVQGEPGSGKSTLVEHWIERWLAGLDGEPGDGMLLPILVRFRDLPGESLPSSGSDLAELFWNHAYNGDLGTRYPTLYAESRKVMFVPAWFLDGWDEARSDEYHTDGFFDRLRKLPGLTILTCRTAVLAKLRQPTKFDYHVQPNRLYTLRDLDLNEQLSFLNKRLDAHPKEAAHLHRTLQQHSQMRAISASPLLLGLIADMAQREFVTGLELRLPGSRSTFYRDAIKHSWTEKLQGLGATDEDTILRDDVLEELAGKMELENITIDIRTLIEVMKTSPDLQVREQRERLLSFLGTSGLLRSPQTGVFEFVHLTFQEYYLARRLQRDGFEKALYKHWGDPKYDETMALMMSQLVERGEASIVEEVLARFVEWGQEKYETESDYLLNDVKRSPLRWVIHLVNRAATPGHAVPRLMALLAEGIHKSTLRTVATANDSNTPAGILEALAKDQDRDVRTGVAGNSSTNQEILRDLTVDKFSSVRWAVAENSTADKEILTALAKDKDKWVRTRVARNSNTPQEILRDLAHDESKKVRSKVARNSNTPQEILRELAHDESTTVLWWVIRNSNTGEGTSTALESSCVRPWVAQNRNTPQDVLRELATDEDSNVRVRVASNPNTPQETRNELVKDQDSKVRRWAVCNLNTGEETIRGLESRCVRLWVAWNRNTPQDVLRELATDEDSNVRMEIASNPNTPQETFRELAKDKHGGVRERVAQNPSTPREFLLKLGKDKDRWVRECVTQNSNTPLEALLELAKDKCDFVRARIAENPNVSGEVLKDLAKDAKSWVRETVACNPNFILECVY